MRRAVFLDRDGTVIRGILRPELGRHAVAYGPWYVNEINFEPYVGEAMRIFKSFGYLTVFITNQPDVAYGHLPKARWQKIFDIIVNEVRPDHYYYCPHPRGAGCDCKKPKPGLLLKAARELKIDLKRSWMIGDTENDTLAGKAAGCRTILIRRPYNINSQVANENADRIVPSLLAAAAVV